MSYNEIVDKTPAAGGMTAWAPGMEPKKKRTTRYEVQEQVADPSGAVGPHPFVSVGVVEAVSARAAIRDWYETNESDSAAPLVLRAIPVRNITQVTVGFKTSMQLTFS